jgi:Ca2+/H+ antiporter, TMEM165/GDT1 family
MAGALAAFAVAFAVVLVAEMGDKSQLVLLARGARGSLWRTWAEAAAAFAVLAALAVTVGAAAARWLPAWLVAVAAGLLFLAFGALALRTPKEDGKPPRQGGTFLLVLVSELGDKTQLATAALAASSGQALATGVGAFAAESGAALLALAAGGWLARRLSPRTVRLASAVLFLLLGVATLAYAAWSAA